MDRLQIKNHYGKYSKKELHKLVLELYNDNLQLKGQLMSANNLNKELMAKNIELTIEFEKTQEK